MPWFKVDDQLHSHPKARRVSLAALGLWSMGGSYAMAYKTNGFVPDWFAYGFPQGKRLASELVRAGLWDNAIQNGENGFQYHDWLDYQPSADEIEAEREAARKRQRAHREKRRKAREAAGDEAVSHANVTPLVTRDMTRESQPPVPSRPYPTCPALYRTTGARLHHSVAVGNAHEPINAMMRCAESTVAA